MFLYGKNSVFERLKTNPKAVKKVFLQDNFNESFLEKLIKSNNIPLKRVSQHQLHKIKRADLLQGIVAQVDSFQYADFEDLLDRERRFSPSTLIFLDRIYDPQNLGAIIRIAACFGAFSIVLPKHKACQVTETVLHVAQGAENYVSIAIVSNLTNALLEVKKAGFWVVGSVVEGGQSINNTSLPFPLCFVLGSEGEGIRYGITKHLDLKVHIPMKGAPISFNVSTACAIFCHEISEQSGKLPGCSS